MLIKDLSGCREFAELLGQALLPLILTDGFCVGLDGELGAGKTTLVRYLAQALGSGDLVSSPSYVLQNLYQTGQGIVIAHWDLYRLKQQSLPEDLAESLQPGSLTLIEWPGRSDQLSEILDIIIRIEIISEQERKLQIEGLGPGGKAVADIFCAART